MVTGEEYWLMHIHTTKLKKKALQNCSFYCIICRVLSCPDIFSPYSSFYLFLFSFSTADASRKPGVRLQRALINILLFTGAHSSIKRNFADTERKIATLECLVFLMLFIVIMQDYYSITFMTVELK